MSQEKEGFDVELQKGVDALNAGKYSTALAEFTPLAEAGNVTAQYNLGKMYRNGKGVARDYAEAVKWWCLAAEAGNADAQNKLGVMYHDGEGVEQDYAEALKWFRLAADAGNASAQCNLGGDA